MIKKSILSLLAATLMLAATPFCTLATQQTQPSDAQPNPSDDDPIRQLNLSPEQIERIREIRQQLRGERATVNQRLSETNRALREALDADNPNESVIEQRLRDVAEAQAAAMRIRVLSEVRIRRVLTPDQLITLRTLRQNARRDRRERMRENMGIRRQERVNRQRALQKQGNSVAPLGPGRGEQQQRPRP